MRKIIPFILLLVLMGCKNFETQKFSSKEILHQKMEQISWNEVDRFPYFESCKNRVEKEDLKKCFVQTLSKHLYRDLAKHQLVLSDSIRDQAILQLVISDEGTPSIDSIIASKPLKQKIPNLKKWLSQSLDSLPKIYPATTHGIPVSVKFSVPIRIVSN